MLGGAIGNLTVACFAAGTPLVVDFEGNSRSIEEIEVGDCVLARSEFDAAGPLELKRVEEKFVRVAPVLELVVRGQVITTTAEHPFFVAGEERFVPARELTLEDSLVDSQGRSIAMDAIRVTDRLITVYNLRVADFHTYFVGGKLWKFDAWVHNAGQIDYVGGVKVPVSSATRTPVKLAEAGEDLFVGGYGQVRRANIKSGLNSTHTPHHSVQDAVSSTSHSTGVSINMRKDLHALTRTYRKPVEEGLSLRQHLYKDVWDVKKILTNAGYDRSVINAQLKELIRQNNAVGGFEK